MSRRKQAKPRALKRGEWDEISPDSEMGISDQTQTVSGLDKESETAGDEMVRAAIDPDEADSSDRTDQLYRCESCGLSLSSLKCFMDHRNFDCMAGIEDTLMVSTPQDENQEEPQVPMETENSLESDMTVRDPPSWRSDTPDDQSLSPSSCATPTDPDQDLNYTIGVTENTPYACQFCDKAFPRLSYLKRHEQSHGDQMPFKCDFCHRLFKHKRSRDRHIKLHTGDKKYRCPHCDSAFSRSDHLKIHMKTHDTAKPFQCTVCNRGYNTAAALTSHMQNHKRDSPLSFRCMKCTALFQTSQQLQDHLATHSSNSSSPTADRNNSSSSSLTQCPFCNHVATGQETLTNHIEQKHNHEKPKCPICTESFLTLETLYQHMKVCESDPIRHDTNPHLSCIYCTKSGFVTVESLHLHIHTMHGTTSSNGDGNNSPKHSPGLIVGRPNSTLGGRPAISPGLCTTLGPPPPQQSLSSSSSSSRHLQTPSPIAASQSTLQYNCEYCTMKFTSIQSLQKHTLSVHSFNEVLSSSGGGGGGGGNSAEFTSCPHCTMGFANVATLNEHIEFVHDYAAAAAAARSSSTSPSSQATSKEPQSSAAATSSTTALKKNSTPIRNHSSKPTKTSHHNNHSSSSSSSNATSPNNVMPSSSSSSSMMVTNKVNGDNHEFAHPGTLLCNQCNAAFPDFEAFRTHLKTHLDEVVQKHVCSECQGEFGSDEQLDNHVVGHYLSTTTEYGCQNCLKLFSKPDELQKHLMDIHAHHLYRCSLCNKVFDSKVSVQVHFAVKHSDECKLFKCTSCSSVFRSEMEFQLHVKVSHLRKVQPFRCLFCNFSYNSELELQCHLTTHKKQFACSLCDEAFHVEFLLDRHMQNKHAADVGTTQPQILESQVTSTSGGHGSASFGSGGSNGGVDGAASLSLSAPTTTTATIVKSNTKTSKLSTTMTTTTATSLSPTSKKDLKCDVCESEFLSDVALNAHRRQVHNIRISSGSSQKSASSSSQILSLYCAYCNESCKSRTELENHMKVHTINCGKHKCNICDEVCPTATILAEHKLTHCKVVAGSMCVICKVNLKSEDQYYSHLQQHNSQGLPLPCVVCRQTLMSEIEVQMHVKFHLKNSEPLFQCCLCLKQYEIINLIHNGTTTLNGNVQSYVCKECYHRNLGGGGVCGVVGVGGGASAEASLSHELRCTECKVKFESASELEKHRSAVHKKTYQCIKCQMSFNTENEIQLHVASHMLHEGTSHECKLCHKVYDSPAKLQCHLIEHTFEGCTSYSCYMCSAVFTTACLLQQHMLEHGLNSRPYDCSHCHQRFFFRAELENHIVSHGSGGSIESFHHSIKTEPDVADDGSIGVSEECLRAFVGGAGNHRKAVSAASHRTKLSSSNHFKCSLCADLFANSLEMQQHYFKVHSVVDVQRSKKYYRCSECPKEFTRNHNTQSGNNKFACSECPKEFTLARNLGIHMRSHNGEKPYECPICKRRFARKENRKAHFKSHGCGGGGASVSGGHKPFSCPHCGKSFSRKCHFKEHLRVHLEASVSSEALVRVCDVCCERVASARALRKHMVDVHRKEYDFKCRVCSDPFSSAKSMKRHLRRVHGIVGDESQTSPCFSSDSGDTKDYDDMSEEEEREREEEVEEDEEEATSSMDESEELERHGMPPVDGLADDCHDTASAGEVVS